MITALIDGDIVAYRCAASCEKAIDKVRVPVEPLEVAFHRVDDLVQRILHATSSDDYISFISGSENFRTKYNPEYKAQRKDLPRPEYLQPVREYLVTRWNSQVTDGIEADDAMAIHQTKLEDSVICTIDKDLLQVPGKHYNFVKEEFKTVSPKEGLLSFYWQLIMGDKVDNIFGFDGKARPTTPKFLEPLYEEMVHASQMGTELDLFDIVREKYSDDERLLMNGICLWVQRTEGEIWKFPT